jgi:hypothetical protein
LIVGLIFQRRRCREQSVLAVVLPCMTSMARTETKAAVRWVMLEGRVAQAGLAEAQRVIALVGRKAEIICSL